MIKSDDKTPGAGIPIAPASEAVTKVEKVNTVVLHVTTPPQSGSQVRDVQIKLAVLGFLTGACDGIYGPATEAAVRTFQRARGLTVDGTVGPITAAALSQSTSSPVPSVPLDSPGNLALVEAEKHLGLKESPPGSNRTMFGLWYGHDGLPWCSIFVSYCFALGANKLLCDGFIGPGVKAGKGCAYVPTVEAWLKSTGQWLGKTYRPQPGDIAIFNFSGAGPEHIGIVVADIGSGRFTSVEGNTSVGNDSDGGQVMVRARAVSQVDGFGRIAF
jgi:hypothetical protein